MYTDDDPTIREKKRNADPTQVWPDPWTMAALQKRATTTQVQWGTTILIQRVTIAIMKVVQPLSILAYTPITLGLRKQGQILTLT